MTPGLQTCLPSRVVLLHVRDEQELKNEFNIAESIDCNLATCCCGDTSRKERPAAEENGKLLWLARTIHMRCIYSFFGRETTKFTVMYSVYIQLWPTLLVSKFQQACTYHPTRVLCTHYMHDSGHSQQVSTNQTGLNQQVCSTVPAFWHGSIAHCIQYLHMQG